MIASSDLYENGFISSDAGHYIEFTKFVGSWTIDVTNEIEDDIVTKQYVELGLSGYLDDVNITTIEELKTLEKLLK